MSVKFKFIVNVKSLLYTKTIQRGDGLYAYISRICVRYTIFIFVYLLAIYFFTINTERCQYMCSSKFKYLKIIQLPWKHFVFSSYYRYVCKKNQVYVRTILFNLNSCYLVLNFIKILIRNIYDLNCV